MDDRFELKDEYIENYKLYDNPYDTKEDIGYSIRITLRGSGRKEEAEQLKKQILEDSDKAEKWDKYGHIGETRQAPEKKRPTLREQELEQQNKELRELCQNEEDLRNQYQIRMLKAEQIIEKILKEDNYTELWMIKDELKEILGREG